ncbi:MAG: single-stranded DNA-binding protein [Candidatus Jorgensenbacteria bacterium]
MNLNKVFLIGRLTQDPQLRNTPSGQAVTTISIATNRIWTSKSGERQSDTQFHNVVVWGRQAETVNQFLKKGSLAMVEGRLQTRSWQDNQGQNRRTTEIVCERIQFGPRSGSSPEAGTKPVSRPAEEEKEVLPEINIDDEEIKPEDINF